MKELVHFFFQAEDGIRDDLVTGVQTCALPILWRTLYYACCIRVVCCLSISTDDDAKEFPHCRMTFITQRFITIFAHGIIQVEMVSWYDVQCGQQGCAS